LKEKIVVFFTNSYLPAVPRIIPANAYCKAVADVDVVASTILSDVLFCCSLLLLIFDVGNVREDGCSTTMLLEDLTMLRVMGFLTRDVFRKKEDSTIYSTKSIIL
jgi:hypothetical protein